MQEMLNMYETLPEALQNVTDKATILNADVILSRIERLYPELLTNETKYIDCFETDESSNFTMCVIGADGHAIVSTLRNGFPNATVLWFPNTGDFDNSYISSMQGIILSPMAIRDFLYNNADLYSFSQMIIKDGFLLFELPSDKNLRECFNLMNECGYIPFKMFDERLIFAFYKGNDNIVGAHNSISSNVMSTKKYNKIYCVCPALTKSGGPELMHQLVYQINVLGGNSLIAYINSEKTKGWTVPELSDYVVGHVTTFEDIEDTKENAVIIPEGWPSATNKIKNADIFFWWLSVDNYRSIYKTEAEIQDSFENICRKTRFHMVQSEYAKSYILSKGVNNSKIMYLSDYLNDIYLRCNTPSTGHRKDIILYNPRKGYEFVKNLIQHAPNANWTPIENMTTEQVRDLMLSSKIYIDFGNHPGKDRIPREAAMCGCLVITGRKGSAAFFDDVPIPDKYKIDESKSSYDHVVAFLKECLEHYDSYIDDYNDYRKKIISEKECFIRDVQNTFFI